MICNNHKHKFNTQMRSILFISVVLALCFSLVRCVPPNGVYVSIRSDIMQEIGEGNLDQSPFDLGFRSHLFTTLRQINYPKIIKIAKRKDIFVVGLQQFMQLTTDLLLNAILELNSAFLCRLVVGNC